MNLDELSVTLSESLVKSEELSKVAIPPILYYKLRQWLRQMKARRSKLYGTRTTPITNRLSSAIAQKIEEHLALKALKKNEFMASVYGNGELKFDFGSDVPEKIKKMAISWAKKKGLKPVEVSLNKNTSAPSTVMCRSEKKAADFDLCIQRMKYEVK